MIEEDVYMSVTQRAGWALCRLYIYIFQNRTMLFEGHGGRKGERNDNRWTT
jgi:hypothetical protein